MATMLSDLIARTVPALGYELVDWEVSPKGRMVRVFIDKDGGDQEPELMQSLRERIGNDAVQRLIYFDLMLRMMAEDR